MKYHADGQIRKIFELQNAVEDYQEKIAALLKEADELTSELKQKYGGSFVHSECALMVVYRAIGHGIAGNMNWLEVNRMVRVIRSDE